MRTSWLIRMPVWSLVALALPLTAVVCACGGSTAKPTALAATNLKPVTVVGNQIVERASASPVYLRGVTFTSGVWVGDNNSPSTAVALADVQFMQGGSDFAKVHGWGANAVTLYIDWYWFQSTEGWDWLDKTFSWCRENDLYVVPSMVVYPVGGQRGGPKFWASAQAQADLRDFWVQFVRRYKGREEIAGIDIVNEPQGTDVATIVAYQTSLVDAVRVEDPNVTVFIEPQWGQASNLRFINRTGLVYDAHYYEPFYFTAGAEPWMWSGSVPVGVHYPGDMVMSLTPTQTDGYGYTNVPAGTYDWTQVTTPNVSVPAGAEFAFIRLGSNADTGGTVWFDDIEYSLDGGSFVAARNGSAETTATYGDPLYFLPWQAAAGSVGRVTDQAHTGAASARLTGCTGWCQYTIGGDAYGIGTAGSLAVASGHTVAARAWVRATNAGAGVDSIDLLMASAARQHWDKSAVQTSIAILLKSFATAHNVPVFVGELTPSLLDPRPDIVNYTGDVLDALNDDGIGWTFYLYRDLYTTADTRLMGIYNGAFGAPTASCLEDTEILNAVRARFAVP